MVEELSEQLISLYRHIFEAFAGIWTDLLTSSDYTWPRVFFFGILATTIVVYLFFSAVQHFSKS